MPAASRGGGDPDARRGARTDARSEARIGARDREARRSVCRVRLLIAIPVYNEQKYLGHVLDKVQRFHGGGDVLVVDDGSTDDTPRILAERAKDASGGGVHVIRHPVNRGYGQSLIDAFRFADCKGFDW